MSVVIETTVGDITLDLFTDARPRTCMNFLKLCKMKYYNLNLIFSVERNFIAQMGDPSATGRGGECVFQKMFGEQARFYEGEKLPLLKHTQIGTVSMVSCGSHLFGSQFFITLGENLDSLDAEHLVFGQVVEGLEVICKLNQTLTDEKNRPYQDIRISHTVVLEDPYPDPKDIEFPDESPKPTREVFESDYIAADETIDDTEGKTMVEIREEIEEREAKARATILEMVGDLPDAEMAPPENVLFVCKLNPVTTSEDLEIIFSRFGKIKSCEVIRDKLTNNSLHYAFIEFNETKSCEDAYFKMDNVLIDDRRIHVDFSQSVSKIKWRGKGRGVEFFDDSGRKIDEKKGQSFDLNKEYSNQSKNRNRNNTKGQYWNRDSRQSDHGRSQVWGRNARSPPQKQQSWEGNSSQHHRDRHDEAKHFPRDEKNGRNVHKDNWRMERDKRHETAKRSHNEVDDSDDVPSDEEAREKMLKHLKKSLKKKKKKNKKYSSDSDADSSETEKKKKKNKKKKKKKKNSDSEKDSDSDSEPKKKCKKSKKKKKKKKKESSTSDSSD
ncbi:peptidyl-prolyl cis-trans isomerase sig-7-like [Homarus americanus]|uniref:Peptidyl-prolyl cis-trans isomerase n=1 Tax=Homarus americanus TaxID=6706 RepID=A0A8J5NC53_HOMAM|nr:peptidyl-prolyl cis-trans isomerase sig-7-like [Homarus americanus]KAG7176997.1 Peptidyl-prolyl cis-trans isomerase sig-7-like [Homarus americanus]